MELKLKLINSTMTRTSIQECMPKEGQIQSTLIKSLISVIFSIEPKQTSEVGKSKMAKARSIK